MKTSPRFRILELSRYVDGENAYTTTMQAHHKGHLKTGWFTYVHHGSSMEYKGHGYGRSWRRFWVLRIHSTIRKGTSEVNLCNVVSILACSGTCCSLHSLHGGKYKFHQDFGNCAFIITLLPHWQCSRLSHLDFRHSVRFSGHFVCQCYCRFPELLPCFLETMLKLSTKALARWSCCKYLWQQRFDVEVWWHDLVALLSFLEFFCF